MTGFLIGEKGGWDTETKGKPYKDSGEDSVSKPSREAPRKNRALLKPWSQPPGFGHFANINISHRVYWIPLEQLYKTYISELMAKGSHGDTQTTQADARTEGYALQMNRGVPLLRTISTQIIKCGEAELVPAILEPLTIYSSLFGAGRHSADYRRKTWMPTQPQKPSICHACKICWGNDGTELVGVANQCLI